MSTEYHKINVNDINVPDTLKVKSKPTNIPQTHVDITSFMLFTRLHNPHITHYKILEKRKEKKKKRFLTI